MMTQAKSHNKIYFVTTLSLYVGLVLIGATPQVLAGADLSNQSASQCIEFSSRADSISAKHKHRQKAENGDVLPFSASGLTRFTSADQIVIRQSPEQSILVDEIKIDNQKVLTTNLLPRASIR